MHSARAATCVCGRRETEIGGGGKHHRHCVGASHHQPSVHPGKRSALRSHHSLSLVAEQVEPSAERQHAVARHSLAPVSVGHADVKVQKSAVSRCAEPHHDDTVGMAREILALISHSAYGVAHPSHALIERQRAAVGGAGVGRKEVQVYVAEVAVGAALLSRT